MAACTPESGIPGTRVAKRWPEPDCSLSPGRRGSRACQVQRCRRLAGGRGGRRRPRRGRPSRVPGRPTVHVRRPVGQHPGGLSAGRVSEAVAAAETRIDRWLSAVRLVKTRPWHRSCVTAGTSASTATPAKPSTKVRAGDRIDALIAGRERIVEVLRPIENRVGAPVAVTCYVDHTPPEVVVEIAPASR